MAIELAKAYLPIIPSLGKGFKGNLEKEIAPIAKIVGADIGTDIGESLGKSTSTSLRKALAVQLPKDLGGAFAGLSKDLGKVGKGLVSDLVDGVVSAKPTQKIAKVVGQVATAVTAPAKKALEPINKLAADVQRTTALSAEKALTAVVTPAKKASDTLGRLADTALKPGQNFVAGFKNSAEAESAFTGRLGTLGGKVRTFSDTMARPANNFIQGLKSSAAAESVFTGRLGSLGGRVAQLGNSFTKFGGSVKQSFSTALSGISFDPLISRGENIGQKTGQMITRGLKIGVAGAGTAVAGIIGTSLVKGFGRLSAIENAQAKLSGLGNSAEAVTDIMANALAAVKGTAFGMDEAATTAASAVAAGIEPGMELERYLKLVGDAATIAGTDMASMGSIFNKVATSGKVQGDVFAQLSDAGIPVVQMLAETIGASAEEVYKLGSEGKISSEQFLEAMSSMEGAAQKGGDTTTGAFKNMNAAISRFGAAVLEDIFPLIGPAVKQVTGWIDQATNAVGPFMDEVLGGFIAFKASWIAADGDITSSGFPGFMEELAFTLRKGYDTMKEWYPVWAPFTAAVGAATGTIVAYKAALTAISIAQGIQTAITTAYAIATGVAEGALWGLTAAQWAAIAPIALIVASIVGLVVGLKMAYDNVGWFRDMVDGAWGWIKDKTAALVTWWTEDAWPAIGEALAIAGEWFTSLYRDHVDPVFAWIGEVIGAFLSWWNESFVPALSGALQMVGGWFTWLYESVIQPVWTGILVTLTVIGAIILTLFDGIVWAVSTILGPIFTWLWENVISPVFTWITEKIQGFATWWNDTLVPSVAFGIDVLKLGWQSVWDTVSLIWSWIGDKISAAWAWIRDTVLTPLGIFLDIVVGAAFRKLWDTVSLIWSWISDKISSAWTLIRGTVLDPMVSFLDATVGAAFRKLWENVSRVWDQISSKISEAWNWIKTNVLDPMGAYLKNEVIRFFELARDGIGQVWQGIKDLVREPVRFVVETVINGGFIKNYNKLAKFWDGKPLDELSMPAGFKVGGYTGDGPADVVAGIVHKGEYVLPKSATQALIRERGIGFLETLRHYTGHTRGAASGGVATHCRHCAAASGAAVGHSTTASTSGAPPSGSSGIWGGFQHQISRAGRLFVPKMNFMGVNTENVAKAWMGRSAVEIIAGNGSPSVSFHTGGAGTYGFNAGSSIWMQNAVPGGLREAVLIHELGHALSLHHTMNRGSIMHPLQAGPTWPSALDYGSLVRAWGAPGEGVKIYEGGGGGFDLLGMIAEKLTAPVKKLFEMAQNKFAGNGFVNIPLGFGRKMLDSVVDWISNRGSGNASMGLVTPKLYDRGGIINRGIQLIDHQRDTPDYVLTDTQWAAMYQIAETTANTDAGVQYNIGNLQGYTVDEVAQSFETLRRHNEALALR